MASAQSSILRVLYVELILAIDHKAPIESKIVEIFCFVSVHFNSLKIGIICMIYMEILH